nr:NlpC/P60 family protein [uncultured Corynebacterium sp.]
MIVGLLATHAPAASAQPDTDVAAQAEANAGGVLQGLVAEVAEHERKVSELELAMGGLRETANRAQVDLDVARGEADRARRAVADARGRLTGSRDELRDAQGGFNDLARAAMRQGYSLPSALNGAGDSSEFLDRASALRREAEKQGTIVDGLDRARTEAANAEAALRTARDIADRAAGEAERLLGGARTAFTEAERRLEIQRADYDAAVVQRDAARAALDAARIAVDAYNRSGGSSGSAGGEDDVARSAAEEARDEATRNPATVDEDATEDATEDASEDTAANTDANGEDRSEATTTSPAAPTTTPSTAPTTTPSSPGTTEDDEDADDASSDATASESDTTESTESTETTESTDSTESTGTTGGNATTVQTATPANPEAPTATAGDRSAKIETVIARAMSQVGTPYAWGGGDANGPTKGIRDGGNGDRHGDYNKIGFDCSGLTLYAYAGVGVTLPHYTGYQYQRGTQHPASEMERGDLIFYGPNGHGHVAIYLGDGQMIEAPQSGSVVRITAVRYNGMTPNVVRLV